MTSLKPPILIVSHDSLIRDYLKTLLYNFGYPLFFSEREDQVQTKVLELAPALVVLDSTYLNGKWGELEKIIYALNPRPAILVMLRDTRGKESNGVFGEGNALDYVYMPFDSKELSAKVQRLLSEDHEMRSTREKGEPLTRVSMQDAKATAGPIVSISKKMWEILDIVRKVAETDVTVLIRGESGTGKELVARQIHGCSGRRDKPFIKVLCPAIPDTLLESELFGYEKGSFTGAFRRKPGRFEFANEGSIFLDEVGEIPLSLQSKLLQVLQEGQFARIGGEGDVQVNVRIIAATNRDLEEAVRAGTFREDLFYRLNVVNIYVPPLRDRSEDIPVLVDHFMGRYSQQYNKKVQLSEGTLKLFMEHDWSGNVRELEHMVEGIVILGNEKEVVDQLKTKMKLHEPYSLRYNRRHSDNVVEAASKRSVRDQRQTIITYPLIERREQERRKANERPLPSPRLDGTSLKSLSRDTVQRVEKELIKKVLDQTQWNRKEAAKILGISYKALLYKIKKSRIK